MASNTAAKELLGFAKNRLNKYYNPKLYFYMRKDARTGEIESLAQAKAVLSDANYSLLETAHGFLRRTQ